MIPRVKLAPHGLIIFTLKYIVFLFFSGHVPITTNLLSQYVSFPESILFYSLVCVFSGPQKTFFSRETLYQDMFPLHDISCPKKFLSPREYICWDMSLVCIFSRPHKMFFSWEDLCRDMSSLLHLSPVPS